MKPPPNNSKRAPLSPLDNFKAILFHNASVFSKSGNTSPLSADSGIINGFASGGTSDSNSCSFSELSSPDNNGQGTCMSPNGNGRKFDTKSGGGGNVTPDGNGVKRVYGNGPEGVGSPFSELSSPDVNKGFDNSEPGTCMSPNGNGRNFDTKSGGGGGNVTPDGNGPKRVHGSPFSELSSPDINKGIDNSAPGTCILPNCNGRKFDTGGGNVTPDCNGPKRVHANGPKRQGSPLEKNVPKCISTETNVNSCFEHVSKRSSAILDLGKTTPNADRNNLVDDNVHVTTTAFMATPNNNSYTNRSSFILEQSGGSVTPNNQFHPDTTNRSSFILQQTGGSVTPNNKFHPTNSFISSQNAETNGFYPDTSKFYPISVDRDRFQPITRRIDSPLGYKQKCKSGSATPVDSGINRDSSRRFSGSSFNGFSSPNGNTRRYGELAHWRCTKR